MKSNLNVLLLFVMVVFMKNTIVAQNIEIQRAETTLNQILKFYDSGKLNLFNETFPYREENKVTYLAGEDTFQGKKVAYLWPTSGVLSGVTVLFEKTGNAQYQKLLKEKILPGLQNYFDTKRLPACYQSYIVQAGESDRFYDDNIWLAIDFCELYEITREQKFLDTSLVLWNFINSGWDENLGGGIYWCEQKKQSKNTCSNAPASVLALKLYEATGDSLYLDWGIKIYNWTKENLQDSNDFLYFDNKKLNGKIDSAKYTYNSGQMLQAAALLYKITGQKEYLTEAQNIAESAIQHFTKTFTTSGGEDITVFKKTDNWFNTILFRGYEELYYLDNNPEYISVFKKNLDHLWKSVRDENGFFSKDWTGEKNDDYKWLLDQASLVELWARISKIED